MQCPTLFRQTRILDAVAQTDSLADVLLGANGKFQIGINSDQIPEDAVISDLKGLILGTSCVDLYSTSGEPGFEFRESLASLAESARRGGFAKVGILPHTQPAIDDIAALEFWRGQKHTAFMPWGAITKGCEGKQMVDLAELAESVVGFTDAKPIANLALVRRVMEYIKPLGKPLMLVPQELGLVASGVMREGKWSLQYGLAGIPDIAETSVLAALLELVRQTHTPTHFMRISSARSVELLAQAKADRLPITASVPWLNLCLEDRALHSYDPNLRLNPALGSHIDRMSLIAGVKSGTIDAIAVDHTPYAYEEKTVAFEVAPPGAIGLEFAIPMLWQELVETDALTGLELWQALSTNPAKCLNLEQAQLSLQTLFNPKQNWTVSASAIASLSHNTHYLGKVAIGKVI
jgi:dihydroorotase